MGTKPHESIISYAMSRYSRFSNVGIIIGYWIHEFNSLLSDLRWTRVTCGDAGLNRIEKTCVGSATAANHHRRLEAASSGEITKLIRYLNSWPREMGVLLYLQVSIKQLKSRENKAANEHNETKTTWTNRENQQQVQHLPELRLDWSVGSNLEGCTMTSCYTNSWYWELLTSPSS